jgi:uncharacterized protein (DUF58 family)
MPSGRGLVVFGAGLSMFAAARAVGSSGLEIVGIGLVALPFLAGLFVRWGRARLRVRRRLSDVRVQPGTRVTVRLDVENAAPSPSPFLLLEDRLPSALGRPARLVIAGLPAHGSQQAGYTVLPQARGRYRLGPLAVDVTDPFALTRQRIEFDDLDDLLVTPQIEDLAASSWRRLCRPTSAAITNACAITACALSRVASSKRRLILARNTCKFFK